MFNFIKKLFVRETIKPTYSQVFTTLSPIKVKKALTAYEVLVTTKAKKEQYILGLLCPFEAKLVDTNRAFALSYLYSIADAYQWDRDIFLDIIDEEYTVLHIK